MPTLPDPPQALAEVWDRATFNDIESPGLAHVTISRSNKWDTKKAQGSHGGERDFKGADLASVKIQIRLWTADDYVAFCENILPLLEPKVGKEKPKAVLLGHATAWARNLRAVTVDSVSGPDAENEGIVTFDIDCTEHREPDKSNATGKATAGSGKSSGKCPELIAQKTLIEINLTTWEAIRNSYMDPFNYDPVKVGEAESKVLQYSVELTGIKATMGLAGCVGSGYTPNGGGVDGDGQQGAEALG